MVEFRVLNAILQVNGLEVLNLFITFMILGMFSNILILSLLIYGMGIITTVTIYKYIVLGH